MLLVVGKGLVFNLEEGVGGDVEALHLCFRALDTGLLGMKILKSLVAQ